MVLEMLIARQAAVLIAAAAGAYTDHRTGYIWDWITVPLIAFGALLDIIEGNYFGLGLGIAVFGLGYAMYYTGKLGGGDVKLYTGIAVTLPTLNGGVYILSAAVFAALSAIIFLSVFFLIKYACRGIDWGYNKSGLMKAGAMALIFAVYLWSISQFRIVGPSFILFFAVPVLFGCIFIAFEKGIKKEFFLKRVKIAELEEDEVMAIDFMEKKDIEKIGAGFKGVIGPEDAKKLAKAGVKEVLVYRDLPRLGPFIFIGCALAVAFPNLAALLIG